MAFVEFSREDVEGSIPSRFERQVRRYAERRAVRAGTRELTYAELNSIANRIARAILARGAAPDQPIALLLEHGPTLIAAILGVLKAGRIYLPLDPSYPSLRSAFILEDAGAALLVTDERHRSLAAAFGRPDIPVLDLDCIEPGLSDANLDVAVSPHGPAYVLYTSGSTGHPKGVVQSHRNVLWDIREYTNTLRISPEDRMTLLYSCSVNGSVRGIFGALLNGASLYPLDVKEHGAGGLAELLAREEITFYHSVPSVFRHFVAGLTGAERFPKLRLIRFGGERVLAQDVDAYRTHFPDECVLYTGMGATETGQVRHHFLDKRTRLAGSVVPTGYAVEGKEVLLLDAEGREVPAGEIGEIAVRSRYLALGYWRNPDLTRAAFSSDPAGGPERIFRTGDLGRMQPDGCLEHLGRKDFQVKIRGFRIEVAEVEAALLGVAGVKEAVVVAREDPSGDQRLVAYLVRDPVVAPGVGELRVLMQKRLPSYMVPDAFVLLEALPLLPSGKLDRRALPAPDWVNPVREHAFVPPQTPIEERVAAIWAQVLGLDRIGMRDDFFALGANSLHLTQALSRIRRSVRPDFTLEALYDSPTVGDLAGAIEQLSGAVRPDEDNL